MLNEVFAIVVVNHSLNLNRFQHNDSVIFAALPLNPKVVCGFCDRAVSEHFRVAGTLVRILTGRIPAALLAADNGNLQPLKDLHIATQTPVYKCSGWCIPFAEYMRRFWVKTKYYGIIEMYALNKTDIRKELKSNVIEIMEVKKN